MFYDRLADYKDNEWLLGYIKQVLQVRGFKPRSRDARVLSISCVPRMMHVSLDASITDLTSLYS